LGIGIWGFRGFVTKVIVLRHNTKMTEKDLINKLKGLKQIKPRQEWVSLAKSEIFNNSFVQDKAFQPAVFSSVFSNTYNAIFQRKFAYSLAVFLFVFVGISGVINYGFPQDKNTSSQTALVTENTVKSNVESFKAKSKTLAEATTDKTNTALALSEVKSVAKELTVSIKKDPQLARTVALEINNNKTLLDISGGNDVNEVSNMYKVIVVSLMDDLSDRTLSVDQTEELQRIKNYLKDNGDYITALRDILLISKVSENK